MINKLTFPLLLLILLNNITFAQSGAQLSGLVKGAQNNTLTGATVRLNQQSKLTGADGRFSFNNLPFGIYKLVITHVGLKTYQIDSLKIDPAHLVINLPLIILQTSAAQTLKEVTIVSKKPLVEQLTDRVVVNIDAMISAAGSNAIDLLGKSPGVVVNSSGDISLNGKNNVLVLIDDKPTYLSTQELAAYLRSLPGGMLDKLELISNPPAKYDANGNAIINIVLKRNQAAGFNGALNIGYNQGVYARINNALNVNYRTPKFNLFGNIGYNHDQNYSDQSYSRYFTGSAIRQTSRYTYTANGYNGRIGMDYFASPKTTIGFILSGSARPRYDLLNYAASRFNATNQPDSINSGYTSGRYQNRNYGANLNLQHKFDSAGKSLGVNLDLLNYSATANQQSLNASYLPDGSLANIAQRAFSFPSNIHIYSAKADYNQPMRGKAEFSAGIKSSYVSTNNQSNWFDKQEVNFMNNYNRSNHFSYAENISSAYINIKKDLQHWSVQAGLRAENTNANGRQYANPASPDSSFSKHYTNLFPSLFLLRKLDSAGNNTLVLSFSRRIRRPSYTQLNPFLFFVDQYSYNGGNTALVPSFTQYIELRYSYKQYFGLTLSYGGGNNGLNQLTQAEGDLLINRPYNFIESRLTGIIPYLNISPVSWWNLNLSAVILFQSIKGSAAGVYLNQHVNTHEIETTNQFQLGKNWSAELNGFFPGSQTYGQSSSGAIYNINGGIQKRILKRQGSIRLNVNDIFHSLDMHSQILGINGVSAFNTRSSDTRYLAISFSYRFGKVANARKRNDTSSAEDEKGRTN